MAPRLAEACSHIVQAIREIDVYMGDLPTGQVLSAPMHKRAIERCLQVITEGGRHIPGAERRAHPGIPWSDIEQMSNVLRHEYFRIDPDFILRVALSDLAPLERAVRDISPIVLEGK